MISLSFLVGDRFCAC